MKPIRIFLALLLLLSFACSCKREEAIQPLLQIRVLNVGQGDSILLQSRDSNILIDAGTEQSQEALCLRLEQLGGESR